MANSIYTQKQLDFMRMWQHDKLKRINLLEGSVSSGKTWISLVAWAFWVKTMPNDPDSLYLMSARSLTTLKRNCLLLLQSLVGQRNFTFSISAKEGYLFGRHIILEGANDAQAEAKIRGVTLQGAYVDEATKLHKDFFAMILSRLRKPGAKLFATTNPDAPGHWLKVDYIDRQDKIDILDLKFLIDDNTTLPKEYVENIKLEYTGVFYERFILGNWTLAEGLIYPMFEEAIAEPPENEEPSDYCLSIDYGTQNAFACIKWALYGSVWYAIDEYYYSGRDEGEQKTDEEYADDLDKFIEDIPKKRIETIIDPSAASFIAVLRKRNRYKVRKADNDVLDGIRESATAMKKGLVKFTLKMVNWKKEVQGYVWDEKASEKGGEDKPVKIGDHCLTGDTEVDTLFGKKKIKELVGKIGLCWSYSEKKKKKVIRPFFGVRKTRENQKILKITLSNGKNICCTEEHRILTQSGWKKAKYLKESDKIIDISDCTVKTVKVQGIENIGHEDVYNMEVLGTHNFSVNDGLIVHNCMDSSRYFVKTKKLVPKSNKKHIDGYNIYLQ